MFFPIFTLSRVVCHIAAVGLFVGSLLSGLRLASDSPLLPEWVSGWVIVPQGDVFSLHQWMAYGWLVIVLIVVWQLFKKTIVAKFLTVGTEPPNRKNKLISCLYVFLLVQVTTGLLLYLKAGVLSNTLVLVIHFLCALSLLVLVVIHSLEQLLWKKCRYLWQIILPRKSAFMSVVIFISSASILLAGVYVWDQYQADELYVSKIDISNSLDIDGEFTESAWKSIEFSRISTTQGNNYFEKTIVEVKALHNGLDAFFAIRWPDKTESYQHLPLIKKKSGWEVQHDGFEKDDERTYFEDKFAIMLSESSGIAGAASIHLGRKPLKNKPESRSGRGFHYTTDGSVRDVWHWKALRVNEMSVLDDDHFGPPEPNCQHCARYVAGYHPDPQETGTIRHNWEWFLPDVVTPIRLPDYADDIQAILSKSYADNSIRWRRTIGYKKELDNYPVGSSMPSVLIGEILNGDRGDVRAKAVWRDGYWHLEIARSLITNSKFDLPVKSGIFIWFTPFDHAQTRHSYHLRPLMLKLGEAESGVNGNE